MFEGIPIEQVLYPDMLSSVLGAHFVAELRAGDTDGLDDHEALRLWFSFSNAGGIRYRLLTYGVGTDKGYVEWPPWYQPSTIL